MSLDSHSNRKRKYLRFAVTTIALLTAIAIAVFWILAKTQTELNDRLASSLQTVLETTDKALKNWEEQTGVDVDVLAATEALKNNVDIQLHVNRAPIELLKTAALGNIRDVLAPAMSLYQFPDFAVIASDGVQIAAQRDESVGMRDIASPCERETI